MEYTVPTVSTLGAERLQQNQRESEYIAIFMYNIIVLSTDANLSF